MTVDRQSMIDFIVDHYERPRNRGALENPTLVMRGGNPGCGDIVTLYLRLDQHENIADVSFEGEGCTISMAAASLLTEKVKGLPLAEAVALDGRVFIKELGEEIVASRLKCATLTLNTLKAAERKFRTQQMQAWAASDEVLNF